MSLLFLLFFQFEYGTNFDWFAAEKDNVTFLLPFLLINFSSIVFILHFYHFSYRPIYSYSLSLIVGLSLIHYLSHFFDFFISVHRFLLFSTELWRCHPPSHRLLQYLWMKREMRYLNPSKLPSSNYSRDLWSSLSSSSFSLHIQLMMLIVHWIRTFPETHQRGRLTSFFYFSSTNCCDWTDPTLLQLKHPQIDSLFSFICFHVGSKDV